MLSKFLLKILSKKLYIALFVLSLVIISSCVQQKRAKKLGVVNSCNGLICSYEITDNDVLMTTNVLGAQQETVLTRTPLKDVKKSKFSIKWTSESGEIVDNDDLLEQGLPSCENGVCTDRSNPTGFIFRDLGLKTVHVNGYLIKEDGTKEYINQNVSKKVVVSPSVSIGMKQIGAVDSLEYHFFIKNIENSGIPSDSSYEWFIDGEKEPVSKENEFSHTFSNRGENHTIKLIISPKDKEPYVYEVKLKTAVQPADISYKAVEGLKYEFAANTNGKGLPSSGVDYSWYINDLPIKTGSSIDYTFAKANETYAVSLKTMVAGKSIGVSDESITTPRLPATIDDIVLTGTKHELTANVTGKALPSSGVVYEWQVDGHSIGFGSPVEYFFTKANQNYQVSLETILNGKSVGTTEKIVTTKNVAQPVLSSKQYGSNPLVFTIAADTSSTNIDSTWTNKWYIDDNLVPDQSGYALISHRFDLTNHSYMVKYVASKEGYGDRTASLQVVTEPAKKPVLSKSSGNTDLDYNVRANLTDTGITANKWSYEWTSSPSATFADDKAQNTSVHFGAGGKTYILQFTATPLTPSSGSSDTPKSNTIEITTGMLPATIDDKVVTGTKHKLTANTTDKGLPSSGVTYTWKLGGTIIGTGSSIDYTFSNAITPYNVSLETDVNGVGVGTASKSILTGNAITPSLSSAQVGNNPLKWIVKADTSATNINDSWTKKWYIDNSNTAIPGETGNVLTYTFALTKKDYTVKFEATSPDGGVVRAKSIVVTTGNATAPSLTQVEGNSTLNYNVRANLTDTGITSAWGYKWTSSPSATFVDDAAQNASVDFGVGGTTYTLTFTATPPSGLSGTTDAPQTNTIEITTPILPSTIDDRTEIGTKHTLTANTTDKGLPLSGVTYKWKLSDGTDIGEGSPIEYVFAESNATYNVVLETKVNGAIIGTTNKNITTGSATQPTLTSAEVGNNPLKWTVMADTSSTNISNNWVNKWFVDGVVVPGETGDALTYTFALTKKEYTVKFEATSPDGGIVRTNSIAVTTGDATAPSLSQTAGSSDLSYDVSANLVDTGVTSNWTYRWSSDKPSETTFADNTAKDTSVDFGAGGTTYTLTFEAIPPDGSTDGAQSKKIEITTTILPATIDDTVDTGTKHILTANTAGKGLPSSGVAYKWQVNGNNIGTGLSIEHIFPEANTTYNVSLETKLADGTVVGTDTKDILTGDATHPSLTSTQVGNDPLKWEIAADISSANIDNDWTRKWYVDDTLVTGETDDVLIYDFALTKHKYVVRYVATKGYVERVGSIDVTTGHATAPDLSETAGNSALNYNISADLTDTGITDDWTYEWTSSPSATFDDDTAKDTSVDFGKGGTHYTLKFTATPPSDSADEAQSNTLEITTAMLPATIDDTAITGTKHTLTANTTGKGLPSSGVIYTWTLDGNEIGTDSSIDYTFPEANTTYNVSLETKLADGTVVGAETKDISTNNALQPTLTSTQVGNNPLKWEITANTSNTNIGDDWSRKWYVDNSSTAISGETGNVLTYTFALTKKEYTVKFEATSPDGGVVRTNSIAITTGDATAPTLSQTAGSSDLNYNIDADLTDTGITASNWDYKWTSNKPGKTTFADDTATDTSVDFTDYGTAYTLTFTATPKSGSGSTDEPQSDTLDITTTMLPATIDDVADTGTKYTLTANTTGKGLPSSGVTYTWTLDGNEIGTGSSIEYIFPEANKTYNVSLETKLADGIVVGTKTKDILTGDATHPSLTKAQVGNDPLKWEITADTTSTHIGNDWTKKWYIDNSSTAISGETGNVLTYTFALTKKDYTVKFEATSPDGGVVRTNSIVITTGDATAPSLTKTVGDSDLNYNINADLTDTGITASNWDYKWTSSPSATFADDTATDTSVDFTDYGTTYTLTFTATPKSSSGSTDEPQSDTLDITTTMLPATIDDTAISGTKHKLTANTEGKGLPSSGVTYKWTLDGNEIGTDPSIEYIFPDANTTYTVSLETFVDNISIGTEPKDILTGDADHPSLTSEQVGNNPLRWKITADTTSTHIGNDWTKKWYIDNSSTAIPGETSNVLTYTFALTKKDYTVKFEATSPDGGVVRTNSIAVTTGDATAPTLSQTAGSSDLNYNIDADLTDTGITASNWDYKWTSNKPGKTTFADDTATDTSVDFTDYGTTYTLTFTATPKSGSGSTDEPQSDTLDITTTMLPATIDDVADTGTKYTLTANTTGKGLPSSGVTYTWRIGSNEIGTGSSIEHIFPEANTTYNVSLETKLADGTVVGTETKDIATGNIAQPTLTSTQVGNDPLKWEITADTTSTHIGNDWTKKWYIDNSSTAIPGETGNVLTYTFALTKKDYTVKFEATSPTGVVRTNSIAVTTGDATAPSLTKTVGDSDLNYNINADLTDTGITASNWDYKWTSSPSATFADDTATDTSVDFTDYGTTYTLTFTATPKSSSGSTDEPQSDTLDITTTMLPATIDDTAISGTKHKLTANTEGKGLPSSGVTYKWTLDGNEIGTDPSIEYIFPDANTTYTVSLETFVDNISIGTEPKDILTGDADHPSLTSEQVGNNPLRWKITADTTSTHIGNDWTKKWYIDNSSTAIPGETSNVLTYTFALTKKDYTVKFEATSPDGGVVRTNSIAVTTGDATAPTLSQTAGSSDLNYNIDADLTDTGITASNWDYKWTSNKPGKTTFADDTATDTSVDFTDYGTTYTLTFTATPKSGSGSTDEPQSDTLDITTTMLPATIDDVADTGTKYTLTANTTGKGLPSSGVTYTWRIGSNEIGTGSSIEHIFPEANTTYNVSLETKLADGTVVGTETKDIATGNIAQPTLTSTQVGNDPLKWEITADTTSTHIGNDWTKKWYIDNSSTAIPGETGNVLTYTFALTKKDYTVKFEATSPTGVVRTNSIAITTGDATAPTLSQTAGSSDLNYNIDADLTNTGITSAWSYKWSSSPSATFADDTATDTSVDFTNYGTQYTLTFKATPPNGSTDEPQSDTLDITTTMLPATIDDVADTGTKYTLTANTTGKGLPSSGVIYTWKLGGTVIGTGSSIEYIFPEANNTYNVSLETKLADGTVVGTKTKDIPTGNALQPTLTKAQVGNNPLGWKITANTSNTNIGDDWSRKWYIGNSSTAISGETGNVLTYTFALTKKDYTVKFEATSPDGGVVRTKSIVVTTDDATAPTLSQTVGSSDLNYNINADLTNTGITSAWSYEWTSNKPGKTTFADDTATDTSVDFTNYGTQYTLTFKATPPNGSADEPQSDTLEITTAMLPATIDDVADTGTKYTLTANAEGKGLPSSGVVYTWQVNGNNIGTSSSIDYTFPEANTTYNVSLETKLADGTVVGTDTKDILTGDATHPSLTKAQVGNDPLKWEITADTSSTHIGNDWSRKWYIDNSSTAIPGETSNVLTYTFALTKKDYTVKFEATSPDGGVVRTNSIAVTTGDATAPTLSQTAGSSDLNYNIDADLTNTGITSAWSYKWSSSPSATFDDDTAKDTSVTFTNYGTQYTLTFKATPPNGSTDDAQSDTLDITTTMLPATIDDTAISGTEHKLTANTEGKGLPSSGVIYTWKLGGTVIGTGSSIEYIFPEANTTYNVSLETKLADGTVVGTEMKDIATGNIAQPTLTSTQVGNNPLKWEITANTSNTNIGDDWSRKWYIDNSNTAIPGETGNVLTYTFALTKKEYTVKFEATSPDGGVVRTKSIVVTTGDATAPTLSQTAGSSDLNYNIDADLTDTGITASNWDYKWTSNKPGKTTFADDTAADTSVDFTDYGTTYTLTFTATPKSGSGSTDEPQSDTLDITTTMLPATIDDVADTGTKYTLTANTTGKGLPSSGVTYTWRIGSNEIGTDSSIEYIFPEANTTYNVSLETKLADGTVVGTETKDIATGNIVQPTLTSTQVGNNPLKWEITADTTSTHIGNDWTKKWYIDNSSTAIPGETGSVLTYTFALTKKDYTVKFEATSPTGVVRTNSIAVTTGDATAPSLSNSIGNSDLNYNIGADLTDTGITSDWGYKWTSDPSSATFDDDTAKDTSVTFTDYGTIYTLTFTATPPSGSTDEPQSDTLDITTTMLPATIDDVADTGTKYTLTANTTGKGLPSSGVIYTWQVNGNNIGTGSSIEYIFPEANTTYNVSLETKLADGTIVGTKTKDITTNNAAQPTLTREKDGVSPLVWTITADTSSTHIGNDWTKKWYIDNSNTAIPGETGNVLTYTFALTKKDYTVKFEATSPDGGVVRTNSIAVTTGDATAPTLSQTAGSSDLNYNINADLTDTGITSDWGYKWTSDPSSATFDDDTAKDTSVTFTGYGTTYTLKFEATPPNGSTDDAQSETIEITTAMLPATIDDVADTGTKHTLTANTTGKGLPSSGVIYTWQVNGNNIGTGSSIEYIFPEANTTYNVSLETKLADGTVVGTDTKDILTGDATHPSLTKAQVGNDPLKWEITADTTSTHIGNDWTKKWYIDNSSTAIPGETGNVLTYTFALTKKDYTVKFEATSPTGVVRTNSIAVTTGDATAPTLSQTAGSSDLNYNINADLTNTGITSAWSYEWTSNKPGKTTFADDTATDTSVDFTDYGTQYTLTFTATPPSGSTDNAQSDTLDITTTMLPATIDDVADTGTKYTLTANATDKGLPSDVTYTWTLDGNEIGTGPSIEYIFPEANTTYTVSLETKLADGTGVGTKTKDILTGNALQPTLTKEQVGNNPLGWKITANILNTHINFAWDRKWYVDNTVVASQSGSASPNPLAISVLTHTFALTKKDYTVKFEATSPTGVVRTNSIAVTTGDATAPTLSQTAGSSDLNYNIDADLTDTGITSSNWDYKWTSSPSATFADDTAADTSVDFTDYGTQYTLTFTATPKSDSGSTDEPQSDTLDITTTMLPATIDDTAISGTKHKLTANTEGKGLPSSGVTYKWTLDGNEIGTDPSIEHIFPDANTTYTVSLETFVDNISIGTEPKDILTGDATHPSLTKAQVGNDPLKWEITADTTSTHIGNDWTKKWYIDNSSTAIPDETGNVLTYTFALTKKDYTVKFEATSPTGVVRTNSIAVTTGDATAPTLSQTAGSSDLNYNISADLTDTGITASNWDYKWTSSPSATFADDTAADTSVDFTDYGTTYTLTFTATPKSGSGSTDEPQSDTLDITTIMLPATIDDTAISGTKHKLTANTEGKGLPSSGVTYKWTLDGNEIGTDPSIEYIFPEANTTYNVSLETKLADGTVVGTEMKDIATGNIAQPTLTSTQVGNNPLEWQITANTSNTNIGNDWSRKWYIDNSNTAIPGETGNVLTYTFALTKKDYTVKFEATSPDGGLVRTNSIAVTTGDAAAPSLFKHIGSSDLNYDINADLTNTGITSAWSYKWSSSPSATFTNDTAIHTDVDFTTYDTEYTLTFTATPPAGANDGVPVTNTINITPKQVPTSCFVMNGGTIANYRPEGMTVEQCPNDLVIPSDISGVVVTGIGFKSFENKGITSINIPNTVTSIGTRAFGDNLLRRLVLPSSVTSIGSESFRRNDLTSVVLSPSLTSIPNNAFYANEITSVDIPSGVTSIGDLAFKRNQLTSVTLHSGLISIGAQAFYVNKITSLNIPDTVTTIGDIAFRINQLTSLTIPSSVTSIKYRAFSKNRLTSLNIASSSTTSIGSQAFNGNRLTSLTIPSGIISIGSYAFTSQGGDNGKLNTVTIESNSANPATRFNSNWPLIFGSDGVTANPLAPQ